MVQKITMIPVEHNPEAGTSADQFVQEMPTNSWVLQRKIRHNEYLIAHKAQPGRDGGAGAPRCTGVCGPAFLAEDHG
jgi:hypothetical protein